MAFRPKLWEWPWIVALCVFGPAAIVCVATWVGMVWLAQQAWAFVDLFDEPEAGE